VVGLTVCALAGERRRFVARTLRRVQGRRGAVRDAVDVARTFMEYATNLTEVLSAGSPRARVPTALVRGELHLLDALAEGRGVIFATAHTGGWELVGPLLARDHCLRVMIVERAEQDERASAIQDEARRAQGVLIAHVGEDPMSALPLARHLREGGVVALQIDRTPAHQRSRAVTLFGEPGRIPEGPLRLAALSGAPILPVFAARTGARRFVVEASPAVHVARTATEAELDAAAQALATRMEQFVRVRPTQWFHFRQG
jgi:KDO2-lipid IV(A) lauroyltransferase